MSPEDMSLEQHLALSHAEHGAADAHAKRVRQTHDADYWYHVGYSIADGMSPEAAMADASFRSRARQDNVTY